jgi:hypothetical protein
MDRDETIPPLGDELMMNWAEDLRQALETIAHGEVPDDERATPEAWMRRVAREVLDELYSAAREQVAKEQVAWEYMPTTRTTIHLIDERGDEVFRSPSRFNGLGNGRGRLVSVEPAPITVHSSRFEIRDEDGNVLWTGEMSEAIPAGDRVSVDVQMD